MGFHGRLPALLAILFLLCIAGAAQSSRKAGSGDANGDVEGGGQDQDHQSPPPPPSPSPPPPPPPSKIESKEDFNATAGSSKNQTKEEDPPPSTGAQPPPEAEEEDPGHCCGLKMRACLSSPGDSSDGMLSLVIKSHEVVKVEVITPSFLSANPSEFTTTADGKEIQVKIEMVDPEAAKLQSSIQITVKSNTESCKLPVPSHNLGYSDQKKALLGGFRYSPLRTPVVGLSMLAAALVLVMGSWLYCRYRVKKTGQSSAGEHRYVELEMGAPDRDGAGTALEVEDDGSWDKVWDEEWDDGEEAVGSSSFKLTESLSAKGLAPRRTSKDGRVD
ncbi:hypothetical protein SELMODRAFT_425032 [Selaginella moellendorffii]|uniref:Uncharacterized protein n=1 Tax=Selaginella moellendorffii TaxID=88036 RepID=D8SRT6_SELML|nr:uncharacterized protein LOC9639768 [Selaginella moellendorffii]EFJ12843.1 hypothetical protein SELMODRAFT_425032 [Selaginella moellendorffii]|eukprot:XP_002986024.1 uncharacterized protein LOC9639768 [Selaginella moellendorffii]